MPLFFTLKFKVEREPGTSWIFGKEIRLIDRHNTDRIVGDESLLSHCYIQQLRIKHDPADTVIHIPVADRRWNLGYEPFNNACAPHSVRKGYRSLVQNKASV